MANGNLVTTIEVKDDHGRIVETKTLSLTLACLIGRTRKD